MAVSPTVAAPKSICLFLGAGASAKLVPPTFEMVEAFRDRLKSRSTKSYKGKRVDPKLIPLFERLVKDLSDWKLTSGHEEKRVDVETLLEALAVVDSLNQQIASAFLKVRRTGLAAKAKDLRNLMSLLQDFIREKSFVGGVPHLDPLLRFIRERKPVHIFTVNYDLVIERLLETNQRTYSDGFGLKWDPRLFSEEGLDVCLYKMHGSAMWYRSTNGDCFKIPVKLSGYRLPLATGGSAEPLMLYPAQKWVNAGVFLKLLDILNDTLCQVSWVVVVGYSFSDDHFLRAFQEAAHINPKLRMILVDPDSERIYSKRLTHVPDSRIRGAYVTSALAHRVIRLPFRYENVVGTLFSTILQKAEAAVALDLESAQIEEMGSVSSWDQVASLYLEAGQSERPSELAIDKINWGKVGDSYPFDFYGRMAIILATQGNETASKEAWAEVCTRLWSWLQRSAIDTFGGGWLIRLKFDVNKNAAKSSDQILKDLSILEGFAKRYSVYVGFADGLPSQIIQGVEKVSQYFREVENAGQHVEDFVRSRENDVPDSAKKVFTELDTIKSKLKGDVSSTPLPERVRDLILAMELEYQAKKLPFLKEFCRAGT